MANDRYVSALEGFAADGRYEAASVGAFNPTDQFGAFVLFYLTGGYQNGGIGGSSPDSMFLWGNYDPDNEIGWSLELEANGSRIELIANLGTGGDTTSLRADLNNPPIGNSFIERLILLEFWQTDLFAVLAVNGCVCNESAQSAVSVAPSARAASLGAGIAAIRPANYAGIVSCGYHGFAPPSFGLGLGTLVGNHFREARGSLTGGPFLLPQTNTDGGLYDFAHRYEMSSLRNGGYSLGKSTRGAVFDPSYPNAQTPASIPDVGNQGFTALNVQPVELQHAGDFTNVPALTAIKNPDWYIGQPPTVWKND